jgi:amino acid adenylation domain-containing protein
MLLHELLINSCDLHRSKLAAIDQKGSLTYSEINQRANQVAHYLLGLGVKKGDRVGIMSPKTCEVLAIMQGCLRIGAIYVPIESSSPIERAEQIIIDCQITVLIVSKPSFQQLNKDKCVYLTYIILNDALLIEELLSVSMDYPKTVSVIDTDDVAYILYTSGSTGIPKGVCITHGNAVTFAEWAAQTVSIQPSDNLANHAPFCFDLSVFDIYVSFYAGATVCLIPSDISYSPHFLEEFVLNNKITVWYSVPSALMLLLNDTQISMKNFSSLHTIIFAGEIFPIVKLKQLMQVLSGKRFFNFYGPTETNVCTYFEVDKLDASWEVSVPIGKFSCSNHGYVIKSDGAQAGILEEGELYIQGPTVMKGYWNYAPIQQNTYATGDVVKILEDGNLMYIGRRDQMVKIRGHRVELKEIESAILKYSKVDDVAVIFEGANSKLYAVIVPVADPVHLIELKQYLATKLPKYMLVDRVFNVKSLPKTPNGKINKRAIKFFDKSIFIDPVEG